MSSMRRIVILLLTSLISIFCIIPFPVLSDSDGSGSFIADIPDHIPGIDTPLSQKGAALTHPGWKPGETSLSNLTPGQEKKIRGLKDTPLNESVIAETPPISVPSDLPESFDWRDNGGGLDNTGEGSG